MPMIIFDTWYMYLNNCFAMMKDNLLKTYDTAVYIVYTTNVLCMNAMARGRIWCETVK